MSTKSTTQTEVMNIIMCVISNSDAISSRITLYLYSNKNLWSFGLISLLFRLNIKQERAELVMKQAEPDVLQWIPGEEPE